MALVTSTIRSFAKSMMPSYIGMGFSGKKIQQDLIKRFGKAYRYQNILNDMRTVTGLAKLEHLYKNLPKDLPIPKTRLIETELLYPAKYRIHATVQMVNQDTGDVYNKRISFYDDENLGETAWLDRWSQQFVDGLYDTGIVVTTGRVTSVEHDKRFPY